PVSDVHSQIDLTRGPAGENAFGKASIAVKGAREEFALEAHMLSVRSPYRLFIDGNQFASDVSANLGSLSFGFVKEPGGKPLPIPVDSVTRIRRVELRNALDQIVLEGNFIPDTAVPVVGFVEREARLASTGVQSRATGTATARIESLA